MSTMTKLPVSEQGIKIKIENSSCRDPGLFRTHASSPDLNQGPSDLLHCNYNKCRDPGCFRN